MNSENTDRVLDVAPAETGTAPDDNARAAIFAALLWLSFLIVLKLLAPFVPVNSRAAAIAGGAIFIVAYSVGAIGLASRLMQIRFSLATRIGVLVGLVAAWWFLSQMLAPQFAAFGRVSNPTTAQLLMHEIGRTGIDISLLLAAMFLGSLVAQIFSAPNVLGPLCAFCLLLDVWFVLFGGIAAQIAEKAPRYAEKVTASVPAVGAATTSQFALPPIAIGAADYLLLGLVFAAMHRFAMNWRESARWMFVLVSGALLAVGLGVGMLPGFVFIALATLIPNRKFFQFTREERFALLYAGGFVVLLTIGLHFATPYLVEQMKTVK